MEEEKMTEVIVAILVSISIIIVVYISAVITNKISNNNWKTGCFIALCEYAIDLFEQRNLFGMVVSTIVFIISIPSMLLVMLIQVFIYIVLGFVHIWKLGNKNR